MASNSAEADARRYLEGVMGKRGKVATTSTEYKRALRKATASIARLQEAVRLAEKSQASD